MVGSGKTWISLISPSAMRVAGSVLQPNARSKAPPGGSFPLASLESTLAGTMVPKIRHHQEQALKRHWPQSSTGNDAFGECSEKAII